MISRTGRTRAKNARDIHCSRTFKMLTTGLLVASLAGALTIAVAGPAAADAVDPIGTPTTFHLDGGALTLSVDSLSAADVGPTGGSTASFSLGQVTVVDNRGDTVDWTVDAATSVFTGPAPSPDRITGITYTAGSVQVNGHVTPGVVTDATLSETATAVFHGTDVRGNNTVTFIPTLTMSLPDAALAGDYSGTVTTSMS